MHVKKAKKFYPEGKFTNDLTKKEKVKIQIAEQDRPVISCLTKNETNIDLPITPVRTVLSSDSRGMASPADKKSIYVSKKETLQDTLDD